MRCIPTLLLLAACTSGPEPEPLQPLPPDDAATQDADGAQDQGEARPMDATTLRARALEAYQDGDMSTFVSLQEQALKADPESTATRYNLACGYARTGQRDKALAELRTLLQTGVDYGAAQDPDFSSLASDPEFQQIVQAFQDLHPKVHHSTRLAVVTDRIDLAPEGIAVEVSSGRTFVSSMRTGTVWALDDRDSEARKLATLSVDGVPLSAFGLELDEQRGVLWAVGSAFSLHEAYASEHQGTTAVIGLDPATGQIVATHTPTDGPSAGFNDVAVGADGSLYLTGGDVYVLPPGAEHPEPLGLTPPLESTNGITTTDEPGVLYVAANRTGIARVDVKARTWEWVSAGEDVDLRNIDGLDYAGGSLVGVQLGMARWCALRLDMDSTGKQITGREILEQGHDDIAFATHGTVVGDALHYVARAPLPKGTDRGSAGPAAGATHIWSVPVHP